MVEKQQLIDNMKEKEEENRKIKELLKDRDRIMRENKKY
jgi:hypothetical protein